MHWSFFRFMCFWFFFCLCCFGVMVMLNSEFELGCICLFRGSFTESVPYLNCLEKLVVEIVCMLSKIVLRVSDFISLAHYRPTHTGHLSVYLLIISENLFISSELLNMWSGVVHRMPMVLFIFVLMMALFNSLIQVLTRPDPA